MTMHLQRIDKHVLIHPISLRSRSHCTASLSLDLFHPQIDPSEEKLLLVESLRFRILEVDLQSLLAEAPARENSLVSALTFCGEDEALPEGVKIFSSALPGVFLFVFL